MGYIKAEYTGNELDFRGNACSVVEYVAFACGVAKEELFKDMKTAIIEEIKAMEMNDYESNIRAL